MRRRYLRLTLLGLCIAGLGYVWVRPSPSLKDWNGVALPESPEKQRASSPILSTEKGVERRDEMGRVVWSRALDPRYRWGVVYDSNHVYAGEEDGVTAFNVLTGQVVWHKPGPNDSLCLSGNLLVAVQHGRSDAIFEDGRWLVARLATTGAETFRVRIPFEFESATVRALAGQIMVQETRGRPSCAWAIDHEGNVRQRFNLHILDAYRIGDDRVFITSRGLMRVSPDGTSIWSIDESSRLSSTKAGGIRSLPSGDLLAFWYCAISDSGVHVMRLDPEAGTLAWTRRCGSLGVMHSEYYHWAELEIGSTTARVTSRGSSGTFFEILDLESGRRLKRDAEDLPWQSWIHW